jgi:hypothetical protein
MKNSGGFFSNSRHFPFIDHIDTWDRYATLKQAAQLTNGCSGIEVVEPKNRFSLRPTPKTQESCYLSSLSEQPAPKLDD